MSSRAVLDVSFVVVVTVVTFAATLLPKLCFGNGKRLSANGEMFFHLGNMMAAGAILGTAFCDLLPEAVELLSSSDYPVALCLAGVGYIVTLLMEVVVTALSGNRGHLDTIHSKTQAIKDVNEAGEALLGVPETATEHDHHVLEVKQEHYSIVDAPKVTFVSAVILTIALSYHSMMAGAVIGAQKDEAVAKVVMLAILGHKWLEAYALGTSLVESRTVGTRFWAIVISYCFTLPCGVLAGYLAANISEAPVAGLLGSLSAGTFFFVSFNEIIPAEMSNTMHRFKKLLALTFGFALMAVLPIFVKG